LINNNFLIRYGAVEMRQRTLAKIRYSVSTAFLIGFSITVLQGFPNEARPANRRNLSDRDVTEQQGNAAIAAYEPALAVRGAGCITCHATIRSSFITDFGYGDPYFFGDPGSGNKVGPFDGNIYGDFPAEPGKTGWLTAQFHDRIVVPEAPIHFNLKNSAGDGLKDRDPYRAALRAESLAGYIRALENSKESPATVIENRKVFIGAPDVETLEARFEIKPSGSTDFKFIRTDRDASPNIEGIERDESGKYYTNTAEIRCDGDLFLRGILFLNNPAISTKDGCRIYVAGPIFLQGTVALKNMNSGRDKSNLQLVSTEAVFMGVGQRKCSDPPDGDPLKSRLLLTPALPSIITRSAARRNISPQAFAQNIYSEAAQVPLEDSSCHDDALEFKRLLLNAPVVHSRYSGRFRGLVIAEFALFWQGKSSYEFDPIFKEVPVLPLLRDEDYLIVE